MKTAVNYTPAWLAISLAFVITVNLFFEPWWGVLLSLLLYIIFALAAYVVVQKILLAFFKSQPGAEWASAVFLLMCCIYGKLLPQFTFEEIQNNQLMARFALVKNVMLPVLFLVVPFVVVYLVKKNPLFISIVKNTFIVAIIVFAMGKLYSYYSNFKKLRPVDELHFTQTKASINEQPDIYYFLMDNYTGNAALKKYWNFDNAAYKTQLQHLGFLVSDSARSSTNFTLASLAGVLNLSNFNHSDLFLKHFDLSIYQHLRTNLLQNTLQQKGYVIQNQSFFFDKNPFLFTNGDDDPKFNFFSVFLTQTLHYKLLKRIVYLFIHKRNVVDNFKDYDQRLEKSFAELHSNVKSANPLFVYYHLLYTHMPFRYNGNGGLSGKISYDSADYLYQVAYNNKITLAVFANLIQAYRLAHKPLLIIANSDHGSRLKNSDEESGQIQLFVYDSSGKITSLQQTSDPVNTFRLAINLFFDQHFLPAPCKYVPLLINQ